MVPKWSCAEAEDSRWPHWAWPIRAWHSATAGSSEVPPSLGFCRGSCKRRRPFKPALPGFQLVIRKYRKWILFWSCLVYRFWTYAFKFKHLKDVFNLLVSSNSYSAILILEKTGLHQSEATLSCPSLTSLKNFRTGTDHDNMLTTYMLTAPIGDIPPMLPDSSFLRSDQQQIHGRGNPRKSRWQVRLHQGGRISWPSL